MYVHTQKVVVGKASIVSLFNHPWYGWWWMAVIDWPSPIPTCALQQPFPSTTYTKKKRAIVDRYKYMSNE